MANETCFLGTGSTDADCTEVTRTQGILENYEVPNGKIVLMTKSDFEKKYIL